MRIVPEHRQKLKCGDKRYRLTALGKPFWASYRGNESRQFAVCECDCGAIVCVRLDHLLKGNIKSCGCWHSELARERQYTHGGHGTRLHRIWTNMKKRCYNPKAPGYGYWGGKGVRICGEWLDFECFRAWALANGYADNLTIDRIDNAGNYEPANCQWLTNSDNSRKMHEQRRTATT